MKKYSVLAFAFVFLTAMTTMVYAADSQVGTWKGNLGKSKYSPGPPPKTPGTAKIEAVDGGIRVVNDGVDSAGKPTHNEFTAKYDGKDYPVKGDPTRDTVSFKKIDEYTFENTNKKNGKVTTTGRFVYSRDGKTRTITVSGTDVEGRKVNNTLVFDKQ